MLYSSKLRLVAETGLLHRILCRFSLQYGTDLAGLRAPIQAQKGVPYSRACAEAADAATAARVEFDGSAKNKYWESRRIKAIETAQRLADLETLRSMSC